MQYEVEVNGRIRHVTVRRADGHFVVQVDGREWAVDAARIDRRTLSLLIGSASHEVTIVPDGASGGLAVSVGSVRLPVTLNNPHRAGRRDDGQSSVGPERLVSPMPGKVVRVLVAKGDGVTRRQPLVVIEAMKMENEVRSSRDGDVSDVFIHEGQSVDAGTPLIVVVPKA